MKQKKIHTVLSYSCQNVHLVVLHKKKHDGGGLAEREKSECEHPVSPTEWFVSTVRVDHRLWPL